MPHSSHHGVTLMLEHVVRMNPQRVLDVGVGYGKWGFLVREALDFMPGRLNREDWRIEIHGIDAFPYESPLRDWVYDRVTKADVREIAGELRGYDLVVLGDVLEHLPKSDGVRLLRTLLAENRNVLIATPFDFFEQELERNPYERHLSHWSQRDFREWTCEYDVAGGTVLVVALAGRGADYPTRADARASRIAYGAPGLRRRGAVARVVKGAVRAFPI